MNNPSGYFSITNHPSKTLRWWYAHRDEIDMSPPYQRKGKLWSISDKAYLVDSIINGFDVPKLYLADFKHRDSTLNSKKLPYAIIDGKQRFEAMVDFFEGRIVLNSDFILRKNPKLKLGGLSFKDLERGYPDIAEMFENENWDVMSVVSDNEDDINELFVRLNRSKALTGSEIRNAMVGPVSDVTRTVADHSFFNETIKFSTKRAGDLNTAAKLLLFEYRGSPTSTKKVDLDKFTQSKVIEPEKLELAGRRSITILNNMNEVFLPRDTLLSSSGLIPVYYWLVRNLLDKEFVRLREFLVDFEIRRKKNRDNQRSDSNASSETTFSRFDALNRSTNDQGSHVGRIDILTSEFREWLSKN